MRALATKAEFDAALSLTAGKLLVVDYRDLVWTVPADRAGLRALAQEHARVTFASAAWTRIRRQ